MGRNALIPKKNNPEADLVFTPLELAKKIINHFPLRGFVLDPAKGQGAFFDQFPLGVRKDYCEISEGLDFYAYEGKVDWIMTNPPWSHMRPWLNKCMEVAPNIVLLCPLVHFVTKARLRDIFSKDYGLKEFLCVETPPKPWPASGFQLGAMYLQRGFNGGLKIST